MCFFDIFNYDEGDRGEVEERVVTDEKTEEERTLQEERTLRCSSCGHRVTTERERISVMDAHQHTFVNPGGYVFHIGCFRNAPGCLEAGFSTEENTWFLGYSWSYALCEGCFAHLGWFYVSAEESFFGLILDRLVS
jgi:hypothetical protein